MNKFVKGFGALLVLSALMAGCSSQDEATSDQAQKTAVTGESLYAEKCSGCHGANLKGNGKDLNTIKERMTKEEVKAQIKNGVGTMPANLLDEEGTDLVTEWLFSK